MTLHNLLRIGKLKAHAADKAEIARLFESARRALADAGIEGLSSDARLDLAYRAIMPTGLFYAQGVKANVIFFDKKPASETPWTKKLWIYDLRTNKHFTLKTNPMKREDLDEFVTLYNPANRHERKATWAESPVLKTGRGPEGRWRVYEYDELIARDKASLDIFCLKDESLADSDNLPPPDVIAQEIVDDLEAALEQFRLIASDLNTSGSAAGDAERE